jgi:ribosomal-protein-alanine N-acetyltransferase
LNRIPSAVQLTLRGYSPGDFETLYAIDQACYPAGIAYSRRTLRWFLGLPGAQCLVAEVSSLREARIAGFLVAEAARHRAHIITLDVSEPYRRMGIGSALLRETERRLAERGVEEIELETAISNQAGVAFWERHGYRSAGVLRRYYLGRLDAFHMHKSVT